jgi:hypothetical protein
MFGEFQLEQSLLLKDDANKTFARLVYATRRGHIQGAVSPAIQSTSCLSCLLGSDLS